MSSAGMRLVRCAAKFAPILVAITGYCQTQAPPVLRGLSSVRVVVEWAGASESERSSLQSDIELQLRSAGLDVPTLGVQGQKESPDEAPRLYVGIGSGSTVPFNILLTENVLTVRDVFAQWRYDALEAYMAWRTARMKNDPTPITDAEMKEHMAPVDAQLRENNAMPPPYGSARRAATWWRPGVAFDAHTESVRDIVDRYKKASAPFVPTPAEQHMMDLEVQAAMARGQSSAGPGTVRDAVKSGVAAFLNDWLAANPKQR